MSGYLVSYGRFYFFHDPKLLDLGGLNCVFVGGPGFLMGLLSASPSLGGSPTDQSPNNTGQIVHV